MRGTSARAREIAEDLKQSTGKGYLTRSDAMKYLGYSKNTVSLFLSDVVSIGNGSGKRWSITSFAEKCAKEEIQSSIGRYA